MVNYFYYVWTFNTAQKLSLFFKALETCIVLQMMLVNYLDCKVRAKSEMSCSINIAITAGSK